ncbi:MAG: addiction module protein [Bacteroidetes bacterium]|nr:addiction module protein [Bacteroidota bacterium]
MVTITLENSEGLNKTHFKDVEELLAYLDIQSAERLPHENDAFLEELERRVADYKANPSQVTPIEETIAKLRHRDADK